MKPYKQLWWPRFWPFYKEVDEMPIWLGKRHHWGFDLLQIKPLDRALLSVYRSRAFGWEIKILFIDIL